MYTLGHTVQLILVVIEYTIIVECFRVCVYNSNDTLQITPHACLWHHCLDFNSLSLFSSKQALFAKPDSIVCIKYPLPQKILHLLSVFCHYIQ